MGIGFKGSPEPDQIHGERAIPSVNKGLTLQARVINFLLFGFVILLAGFLLFKYYANLYEKKKEAEEAARMDAKTQTVSVLAPLIAPPAPAPTPAPGSTTNVAPAAQPAANASAAGSDGKPVLSPAELLLLRRQSSPVKFKVDSGLSAAGGVMQTPVAGAPGATGDLTADGAAHGGTVGLGGAAPVGGGGDALGDKLRGAYTPGSRATLLPDRNFLLTKTAHIECTMAEALDSTLPGMVSCVQAQDAYGANGAVVLMERGTKYSGEMKHALALGQRRAFILWTRAETPKGVIIDLASPGTDELGRTGVTGEIDTHFWERFGNAIMLSLVDDIGAAIVATQQNKNGEGNNNTTIAFPNTAQGAHEVMAEVLKQTANIPPTLRRHQGGLVNIYVARDLDFRSVYNLKPLEWNDERQHIYDRSATGTAAAVP